MPPSPRWSEFLCRLGVGAPTPLAEHGVTLLPIVDPEPAPLDAFPLRWGIEHGHTRVTEIGEGRIDRIRVEHRGTTPLLVLDGEEVLGARQNRVFNASFLVAPGEPVELPVSCVEQRRWQATSECFRSSGHTVVTSVRATKVRRVATSVVTRGDYDAGQGEVWTGVSRYLGRTQVTSRTSAHAEAAVQQRERIDGTLARLRLVTGQVGVAAISEHGLSLDLFGSPGLLNRSWSVLARGLLGEPGGDARTRGVTSEVRACLDALAAAQPAVTRAPGLGESYHVVAHDHAAGAIVHDGRIYHLLAASGAVASL